MMLMMAATRGNKRTAAGRGAGTGLHGARKVAYLVVGMLLLFAFASCDMTGNGDNGGDGNTPPPTATTASAAVETLTGTEANSYTVQAMAGETADLTVNLSAEGTITGSGGSFEGDIFVNVRNIVGGNGINTFTGNAEANHFTGGTAADVFDGAAGNDTLNGKAGNDSLTGGEGSDTFVVSAGSDTIASFGLSTGDSDTITFSGFTGAQAVNIGDLVFDQPSSGAGTAGLIITGFGDGSGSGGSDMLTLSSVFASGGAFYDSSTSAALSPNAAISLLTASTAGPLTGLAPATGQGTAGDDAMLMAAAGAGSRLFGFEGNDVLTAHADGSLLFGGNGNDTLNSAAGSDTFYGGTGSDTALYASASTFTVTEASTGYTVTGGSPYGTDTLTGIETIQLSGENDTVENLSTAVVTGGIAIDGGAGTDTIALANEPTGVTLDLSTPTNYTGFEAIAGGSGPDTITGSAGNETINGGAGNDTLTGGGGNDTALYTALSAGDTARAFTITSTGTGAGMSYTINGGTTNGTDTLSDIDTVQLSGEDDTVAVGSTNATLSGITIDGGEGLDDIALADGGVSVALSHYRNFEAIIGGIGADTADFSAGERSVYINISDAGDTVNSTTIPANSIQFSGVGASSYALAGIERARGASGLYSNIFIGDDGDNVFEGGTHGDHFIGNAGDDTFVATRQGQPTSDNFIDFSMGDKIDYSKNLPSINVANLSFYKINGADMLIINPDGDDADEFPDGSVRINSIFSSGGIFEGYDSGISFGDVPDLTAAFAGTLADASKHLDPDDFFIFGSGSGSAGN